MGKASRSKGKKPVDVVLEPSPVDEFLQRAGIPSPKSGRQIWTEIERRCGESFAVQFDNAIQAHAGHGLKSTKTMDPWRLAYRDLETARATAGITTPMLRSSMDVFASADLPEGPLLDLGSGNGFLTCFYAVTRPGAPVVGVELEPAGVECGRELASALGLQNVTFVEADLFTYDNPESFAVVTSVAVLTTVEKQQPLAYPFSHIASIPTLLDSSQSDLALAAARSLGSDGVYLSTERLPDPTAYARWIGSLQAAGLSVDLEGIEYVSWSLSPGDQEQLPVIRASRQTPQVKVDFGRFLEWQADRCRPGDEFDTELQLTAAKAVTVLEGIHYDIIDQWGSGQTRHYLIEIDGEYAFYQTNNRGYRAILERGPKARSVKRRYDELNEMFALSGQVAAKRAITTADFQRDLGRA